MLKPGAILMGLMIVVALAAFLPLATAQSQVNLAMSERSLEKTLCSRWTTVQRRTRVAVRHEPTFQTATETEAPTDNIQPVLFLPLVCNRRASFRLFLPFVFRPAIPPATCPTRTPGPPLPTATQPPSIIPTPPPSPLTTPVTIR